MRRKKVVDVTSISDRLCGDELPAMRSVLSRLEEDLREMNEELGAMEDEGVKKGKKKEEKHKGH